jgi:hypothetical protein
MGLHGLQGIESRELRIVLAMPDITLTFDR